jgi:HlyD family secretion protein
MANTGKKKSKKKLFIFGGLGLLVILLLMFAFLGGSKEEIIAVQTEKVQNRTITQTVSATGKINPEFKVDITPEVTGEIVALPVKEGDAVKKGQLLIRIKGDAYVAQKERAEANLTSAKASLAQRKAELDKVLSDYNRMKELHGKGLSSDSELETVKSTYLGTQAMYDVAQANVLQSEASLKEIIEQLNKTTIYSPMDGVVSKLNVEPGERVLGSGFSQGTLIMTISDLNNMEATVDVDENDVVLISVGDTAKIKVDAFSDKEFKGVVTQIGNSAQTAGLGTQEQVVNFAVKIKLLDVDPNLRPGMSCNGNIETETIADVVSAPIQSVTARSDFGGSQGGGQEEQAGARTMQDQVKEIVFVVDNGTAKAVEVETGISDANHIHIVSGLSGDETIISGSYRAISRDLKDGSKIKVEEQNKPFGKK